MKKERKNENKTKKILIKNKEEKNYTKTHREQVENKKKRHESWGCKRSSQHLVVWHYNQERGRDLQVSPYSFHLIFLFLSLTRYPLHSPLSFGLLLDLFQLVGEHLASGETVQFFFCKYLLSIFFYNKKQKKKKEKEIITTK